MRSILFITLMLSVLRLYATENPTPELPGPATKHPADSGVVPVRNRPEQSPEKLSPFYRAKAEALLRTKLSCLGCHRLGGYGGIVGPDLSNLKPRLKPSSIYGFIRRPRQFIPGTAMPATRLPEKTLKLIADYLLQQGGSEAGAANVSAMDGRPKFPEGNKNQALFIKYCAACHGAGGDGKGFNAEYLPKAPTDFTRGEYLATRPDDSLFDAIFAGGYIQDKSHFMPAWGATLKPGEIWRLVAYIRELCACQGPGWSQD